MKCQTPLQQWGVKGNDEGVTAAQATKVKHTVTKGTPLW